MDHYVIFGLVGVILEFVANIPYFRDIFRGTTKPHVFTWTGFGLINAIVASAQYISGGGAGVYVTATVSLVCFAIGILAIFKGEKEITKSDWGCFIGSISAIGLWVLTSNALAAVVIVTIADTLAFIPTIRKAYHKPNEETAMTFAISTIRNIFSLLALQSFTLVNWLYPATLLLSDGGFTVMLLLRRIRLERDHA